jgi:hypothetical protein
MQPTLQIQAQMDFLARRDNQDRTGDNHRPHNTQFDQQAPSHATSSPLALITQEGHPLGAIDHTIYIVTSHAQFQPITYVKTECLLLHLINHPKQPSTRDNAVTPLELGQHILHLSALFLLGSKDQKIEDNDQGEEQK